MIYKSTNIYVGLPANVLASQIHALIVDIGQTSCQTKAMTVCHSVGNCYANAREWIKFVG
jgi:hypothetical protein